MIRILTVAVVSLVSLLAHANPFLQSNRSDDHFIWWAVSVTKDVVTTIETKNMTGSSPDTMLVVLRTRCKLT